MPQLTVAKVKSAQKPGRYGDGVGLYLNVTESGSKSWVQRIVIKGRRRDIGLGGFPAVGLAQARRLAAENRTVVAEGRDPVAEKRTPPVPTFREAARLTHEANLPGGGTRSMRYPGSRPWSVMPSPSWAICISTKSARTMCWKF